MDSRLQDVLAGREDNYILPFYWIKENKREILAQEVQHIQDCGIRAFCVEARPYEHFGEADWWTDMGILLEEAKKRDMKVWLLDDKHFPTGQANGKMKNYPQHRKWHLREEHVDVMGPMQGASVLVSPLDGEAEETLLGAYAYRRTGVKEELEGKPICLTGHVKGRFLYWDVPEGCYRIFLIIRTRKGGSQDYIHLIDRESVKVLLREVYEPHYEHFHEYFGNTFAGFFSDEPQMGNKRFEWLAPDNGFYEYSVGLPGLSLPWSDELERRLREWASGDCLPYLAGLWYPMGDATHEIRVAYMDAVTRLYQEAFCMQLGEWCRAHGVEYIGHIIEDMNAHARLGCSDGHYFRALDGQDMAGIDIVLHQVMPGFAHYETAASLFGGKADPAFFQYVLAKLAASHSQLQPRMKGRAMCEVFGAYGWAEGSAAMKWLIDHLLVRGVNHFVPHAFSTEFPDPDCPPHFYAGGKNPQFADFGVLMRYANKVSHLLTGAEHIANAAILYHGEAEWAGGEYMLVQEPAQVLYDAHIDYDIVPIDSVCGQAVVDQGKLRIGNGCFDCLLVPRAQYLPSAFLEQVRRLAGQGAKIWFLDGLPEAEGFAMPVVRLKDLADVMRTEEFVDVKVDGEFPFLRIYHASRGKTQYWMLFNESTTQPVQTRMYTGHSGSYQQLDFLLDSVSEGVSEDGCFPVALAPYQSVIFVMDPDFAFAPSRPRRLVESRVLSLTYAVSIAKAGEYPNFVPYRSMKVLTNLTGPEEMPEFSGTMRYTAILTVHDPSGIQVLDLGTVGETAALWVNGVLIGRRICPPYRFQLTGILRPGDNTVEIEVANTLVQQMKDRLSRYMQIGPSGLLGPVVLERYAEE